MNKSDKTFRNKLLDVEKPNANYKQKYERQVLAMVEQKITGAKKWQIIAFLVMSLGLGILFGTLAVIAPKEVPLCGRFLFVVDAVFGLAFVISYVRILKKGSIDLKKDKLDLVWTGWGLIVIAGTVTLVASGRLPDPVIGILMLVWLLFFEVAAAAMLLRAIIERSEVNTREKLLEIEYRLAELAEKIESNRSQ
ncbi:MAG: hypothetical protein AMJ75_01895 [Phycisphaerae bacterium SM1_79]|nr:MAG: hypothetical protein AMJ75_01895 [Phycisphaerae bacterium SM1_79]